MKTIAFDEAGYTGQDLIFLGLIPRRLRRK